MTTTVVYPELDAYVYGESTTYSTAREGTGTKIVADNTQLSIGQQIVSGIYYCSESFLSFDTSLLSDNATISDIALKTYINTTDTTTRTFELREYDFGSSVTTDDFISGSDLGNYTLLSSYIPTSTGIWATFADSTNFRALTNLKTGIVHLVLSEDSQRTGTQPIVNERITIRSTSYSASRVDDPYLTITWTDSGATSATIYPSVDGYVESYSATYSTARSGAGARYVDSTGTTAFIGQAYTTVYDLFETFMSFDTSSINDSATIEGVSLSHYVAIFRSSLYTNELRDYNFGSTITTADWVPGESLSSYPLLSQRVISGTGWTTYPDTAAFRVATNIKTGSVSFVISTDDLRTANAPGANYSNIIYTSENTGSTNDPYLTIVYTLPTVYGTANASLGGIAGTASGLITRYGVGVAELGAVTGTATGLVDVYGVGGATLGGLVSTAVGERIVNGIGASSLGEITGHCDATVYVYGQAESVLGQVVGIATGERYKPGTGEALLGGITGEALGTVQRVVFGYGEALLGGITGQVEIYVDYENFVISAGGNRGEYVAPPNHRTMTSAVRSRRITP